MIPLDLSERPVGTPRTQEQSRCQDSFCMPMWRSVTGCEHYALNMLSVSNTLIRYNTHVKYVIGVDEAGRGALAGPVSVGAVLMPSGFDWTEAFGLITRSKKVRIRDSKQISPQKRSILFDYISSHPQLRHASALVPAERIDLIGIVPATLEAAAQAIAGLQADTKNTQVMLDAGLLAPDEWIQESFVRGDEEFPAIALASMVAKVTRDRYMEDMALIHGEYGFDSHKGYGTEYHRRAIKRLGPCSLHRMTFLHTGISA